MAGKLLGAPSLPVLFFGNTNKHRKNIAPHRSLLMAGWSQKRFFREPLQEKCKKSHGSPVGFQPIFLEKSSLKIDRWCHRALTSAEWLAPERWWFTWWATTSRSHLPKVPGRANKTTKQMGWVWALGKPSVMFQSFSVFFCNWFCKNQQFFRESWSNWFNQRKWGQQMLGQQFLTRHFSSPIEAGVGWTRT